MKKIIMIFTGLLVFASVAQAQPDRQQLIDRALICFTKEQGADGVRWIDICEVSTVSGQDEMKKNTDSPKTVSLQMDSAGRVTAVAEPTPKSQPLPAAAPKYRPLPASETRYTPLPEPTDFRTEKKHTFKVSTETYYAKYNEPDVMHQDGVFWGLAGEYGYHPQQGEFLNFAGFNDYRFQVQGAMGQMDYTSNGTGTMDNKDNYTYDLRALMGSSMLVTESSRLRPYVGLGYRYLLDESQGDQSSTGHWGYDRHQTYYYVPIGIDWNLKMTPRSNLGANLEFDYMFHGHNLSELGYLPGYEDIEFRQNRGVGFRGSLSWDYDSQWGTFFISPFWRYWNIQDSNTVFSVDDYYVEPHNTTTEAGVSLGVKF